MTIGSGARAAGRGDYLGDDSAGRSRQVPSPARCLNHEIKRLNRFRLAGSLVAGPLIILIALVSAPHWLPVPVSITAGLAMVIGGLALRLWALGCIDGNKKCRLVEWGPYRYVRHPLYVGSLLYLVGFCVLAGSLTAAAVSVLVFVSLYLPAARAEERLLAAQYGNRWDAYRQDSGALVPKLVRHQPATRMPFRIRRPYREVGALLALLLLAVGFARIIHLARYAQDLPAWFI
jgi:protein-S-isoprenylcysteine O-methyltransferase Ste14